MDASQVPHDSGVGLACQVTAGPGETVIGHPATDCTTQYCLAVNGHDYCTAECSADTDCGNASGPVCAGGFRCAVAESVGAFACHKFCICTTDVTSSACP